MALPRTGDSLMYPQHFSSKSGLLIHKCHSQGIAGWLSHWAAHPPKADLSPISPRRCLRNFQNEERLWEIFLGSEGDQKAPLLNFSFCAKQKNSEGLFCGE